MSIETKLDIGDVIYSICCTKFINEVVCDVCDGKGEIQIKNWDNQCCPKCYGEKHLRIYGEKEWRVDTTFTGRAVGKIEAEKYFKQKNSNYPTVSVRYYPTGMGNWINEEDVFKTEQEALDECRRRNTEFNIATVNKN